jgi:RNA polymerase sigma-70 factor (ECF subfamily)
MLRLAERYGDGPVAELPPLFQRILQNAIRDWFRRQKVRALWMTPFSSLAVPDRRR